MARKAGCTGGQIDNHDRPTEVSENSSRSSDSEANNDTEVDRSDQVPEVDPASRRVERRGGDNSDAPAPKRARSGSHRVRTEDSHSVSVENRSEQEDEEVDNEEEDDDGEDNEEEENIEEIYERHGRMDEEVDNEEEDDDGEDNDEENNDEEENEVEENIEEIYERHGRIYVPPPPAGSANTNRRDTIPDENQEEPVAFCCRECKCSQERKASIENFVEYPFAQVADDCLSHWRCCHKLIEEELSEFWMTDFDQARVDFEKNFFGNALVPAGVVPTEIDREVVTRLKGEARSEADLLQKSFSNVEAGTSYRSISLFLLYSHDTLALTSLNRRSPAELSRTNRRIQ
jgi:hypothetical protein